MTVDTDRASKTFKTYHEISLAYVMGFRKTTLARAGQLTLEIALLALRNGSVPPRLSWPEDWRKVLEELHSVTYDEYDSFKYVGNFGHLVFATTLLDSFLTDTTRFIFLMLPASIGKAQGITVSDIVAAKSTEELLRAAVEKRVRDVSYRSFCDRVQYLNEQYGLEVSLSPDVASDLEHFSGVRNVMIHDQAFYDLRVARDGSVLLEQHSCSVHPRPVDGVQIGRAVAAYMTVVLGVASAVFRHLLKSEPPPHLDQLAVLATKLKPSPEQTG